MHIYGSWNIIKILVWQSAITRCYYAMIEPNIVENCSKYSDPNNIIQPT